MLRVALFCEESAGMQMVKAIAESEHQLVLLLTSPPNPETGRSGIWKVAEKLGYRPQPAARIREPGFAAELEALGTDVILNVHSLYIVPNQVLKVPRWGAYNLHPGPLPRYAGLNAPSWAIYRGEDRYGVTVHRMEAGIDTGDIAFQETFAIGPEDSALAVAVRCIQLGVPLLRRVLDVLSTDPSSLPARPQDLSLREYYGREVPEEGRLRWQQSARNIHDFVRAFDYHPFPSPWGSPRSSLDGEEISILKVALTGERCNAAPGTIRRDASGQTWVASSDEWVWVRRISRGGHSAKLEDVLKDGCRLS